ncbi:MAG: class I adenylate-forming enzyme family protein [Chloroflexota bacterium]
MSSRLDGLAVAPLQVQAAQVPDKLALVDDRPDGTLTTWTFSQLNSEANRLGHALRDLGVTPDDRVVWCGPNSPGVVRAMHARAKLGFVTVPLNYRLTPEEAAYIVDNSDAVAAYVDAEYAETFTKIRDRIPKVREIVVFGGAPPPGMLDGDSLVAAASEAELPPSISEFTTVMYTSGTTGRPKGALRRAPDPLQVKLLLELVGHVPEDVYLTTGPLYHSGPGSYLSVAHLLANTVVLQRRFDAQDWLRLLDKYRVSMTFSAPTPIRFVCNLPPDLKARYDRGSMRRMIANAAPWSFSLKEAYMADFPEDSLWEIYGSTELGVDTVLAPQDQRRKPGSCGQPAPMVEIRLYDAQGREVTEPNVPGEVYVRSSATFTTYYKADERAAETRRGEFATVGDIAYRDEEGYLYICDRKTDMVISAGMNIYPAEIEAVLECHPGVLEAAVFGIPDEQWGETVYGVVVPRAGCTIAPDQLIAFARQYLASYKVPRLISVAAELPHTGSGKVLKRELRDQYRPS